MGNRVIDHHFYDKMYPGIMRTKTLARPYVWWPKDIDIEQMCHSCPECQSQIFKPHAAPVHSWDMRSAPWERLDINFAGPFQKQVFLIGVGSHSNCPEVVHSDEFDYSVKHSERIEVHFC